MRYHHVVPYRGNRHHVGLERKRSNVLLREFFHRFKRITAQPTQTKTYRLVTAPVPPCTAFRTIANEFAPAAFACPAPTIVHMTLRLPYRHRIVFHPWIVTLPSVVARTFRLDLTHYVLDVELVSSDLC